jgi:hypothetical protein
MKSLSASELRANVDRLLDHVIETGAPLEVQRGARKVRIVPAVAVKRTQRLKKRKSTFRSSSSSNTRSAAYVFPLKQCTNFW